ncbi:MAG TPA: NAD(P)-dependent oxidoreductase, partial [Victivallales bacterium]|nr:NAD(P)-dependent oxidoreductase [Victivallales bacterium]
MKKVKLLINLPAGFFKTKKLEAAFERLEKLACEIRKRSYNTLDEISEDIKWAEAIIMWSWPNLNDEILSKSPQLKFAGHINVSRETAESELKHGIVISEARHGWSPAVAEMALGMILSVLRKISDYNAQMRISKEKWVMDFPFDIDPSERMLSGRNVGIVGFGRIGQRLAELLKPFDVNISVYDPYVPMNFAGKHKVFLVGIDELISENEIIVLCAANTAETKNLISAKHISNIKSGAVIVNVGRAWLIDMNALISRLQKGDIYAALDVFDKEPLEHDSLLRSLPNAYLTPHRAGGLLESVEKIIGMLTDDLESYLKGKKLKFQLKKDDLHS